MEDILLVSRNADSSVVLEHWNAGYQIRVHGETFLNKKLDAAQTTPKDNRVVEQLTGRSTKVECSDVSSLNPSSSMDPLSPTKSNATIRAASNSVAASMSPNILVTGGAGYIGSHTVLELLNAGFQVTAIDNFYNSKSINGRAASLERVARLAEKPINFRRCDLLDLPALEQLFHDYKFDAVIHFAGLKAVGVSMKKPFDYYQTNIVGTLNLIRCCRDHGLFNFVFSSSSTVYGRQKEIPFRESSTEAGQNIASPYGRSKRMLEQILTDMAESDPRWNIVILRYFNPVGAHSSGLIGEDPLGTPNNLMPYIARVALGQLPILQIFGGDYPTPDGTPVRDYIHVVDLSKGHICALNHLLLDKNGEIGKKKVNGEQSDLQQPQSSPNVEIFNLGRGQGYSVKEIVAAFEKTCGRKIPTRVVGRRPGDIARNYCDASLAEKKLGWKAQLGLEEICRDMWNWAMSNPNGYPSG